LDYGGYDFRIFEKNLPSKCWTNHLTEGKPLHGTCKKVTKRFFIRN